MRTWRSGPWRSRTLSSTSRRRASTDPNFKHPYAVEVATDRDAAAARLAAGRLGGVLEVERLPSGQIDVALQTFESPNSARSQILSVAAFGIGVIDWSSRLPPSDARAQFLTPLYRVETLNTAIEGDKPIDAQQAASRGFLGIVFVVLLFITIVIYGMWVATGVAAEKSSRVMELMISAASPRQMLAGKVVGIGAAGLTQYLAIAVPALILLGVPGPDRRGGPRARLGGAARQLVGLTPALLAGYGVFFLLGFALFALIYAAMGSFVSRPDDLQTLSLPLSLVAMVGYLTAIVALGGAGGTWVVIASFLPPFSPFVMLARIMVSAVEPWEVVVSVRAAGRGDRGRGRGRDADVRRGRAAVRAAAGVACVRGGGAAGLTGPCRERRQTSVERESADQGEDRGGRRHRRLGGLGIGSASPSAPPAPVVPGRAATNRHSRLRMPGR